MNIKHTQPSIGTNACIHQPIKMHNVNSNLPSQSRKCQVGVLRKSYTQVVKENPIRLLVEKPWTKVNKKNVAAKKGMQKQKPSRKRGFFPQKRSITKKVEEKYYVSAAKSGGTKNSLIQ